MLLASGNKLSSWAGLAGLSHLHELNTAYTLCLCSPSQVLLASGNKLSSWAGLAGLSRLHELKLSDNCMAGASAEDVQGVQACLPNLRVLYLDANSLEQVRCLGIKDA